MKHAYFILVFVFAWLANFLLGGDALIGLELLAALGAGLLAIRVCGLKSAMGLLYSALVLKFLVLALACKLIAFEPWDSRLAAPSATAHVMAIGFGVLLLTAIALKWMWNSHNRGWIGAAATPGDQLKIGYALAAVSIIASYVVNNVPSNRGLIIPFSVLGPAALAYLTFYALDSRQRGRWIHAAGLFLWQFTVGLRGGSKEAMYGPLVTIVLCYVLRRGFKNFWLLVILPLVAVISLNILYPYSQYLKSVEARGDEWRILIDLALNADSRANVRQVEFSGLEDRELNYVGKNMGLLERFMLVKVTDQIVATTEATGNTGWFTITNGLLNYVPRFISSQKQDMNVNNYLGRLSGILSENDVTTSVSYTIFGSLYNAFGLTGVLIGGFISFFGLSVVAYAIIGPVDFVDPRIVSVAMLLQHTIAESACVEILGCCFALIGYGIIVRGVEFLHLANFAQTTAPTGLPMHPIAHEKRPLRGGAAPQSTLPGRRLH